MPNRYTALHESPKGAGDARPTAKQIIHDQDLVGKMSDKTFLVTGASAGIGLELTKALALSGAKIYGTVRDTEKARKVLGDELKTGQVHLIHMELDKLASVKAGADEILHRSGGKLNVLVENAGLMAMSRKMTEDGFEMHFGVCHVAHFLLFQQLKQALLRSSTPSFNSRVVIVSSASYKTVPGMRFHDYNFCEEGSFNSFAAYGQVKLANVWMANHLERLYGHQGLHAIPLHPGLAITDFVRGMPADFLEQALRDPFTKTYTKSVEQEAATPTICAVGRQFEGVGGRYVEDCDWSLPENEATVQMSSDLKTGYSPHTYNKSGEERLWKESLEMIAKV